MPLITKIIDQTCNGHLKVPVRIDRHQLSKRRWRTRAEDGLDLAVELTEPCSSGNVIHLAGNKAYVVEQVPENVLIVRIPDEVESACRLGWFFGNQHLPVDVRDGCLLLEDNAHLRDRMASKGIRYEEGTRVFCPPAHSHGHHHQH